MVYVDDRNRIRGDHEMNIDVDANTAAHSNDHNGNVDMSTVPNQTSSQTQPPFESQSISQPATQATTQLPIESQAFAVSEQPPAESQPRARASAAELMLPTTRLPNDVSQANAVRAIATMMFLRVRLCRRLKRLRDAALAELERLHNGSLAIADLQGMPGNPLAPGAWASNPLTEVLCIIESLPKEFAHFSDRAMHSPLEVILNQLQVIFAVGFVAHEHRVAFFFKNVLSQWLKRTNVPDSLGTFKKGATFKKKSLLWNATHHLFWLPTDVDDVASTDLLASQLRAMFGPSPVVTIPLELVLYGGLLCAPLSSIGALSKLGQGRLNEQVAQRQSEWRLALGTFDEVGEATVRATIDALKERNEPPNELALPGLPCPISAPSVPTTTTLAATSTVASTATSTVASTATSTAATTGTSTAATTSTSTATTSSSRGGARRRARNARSRARSIATTASTTTASTTAASSTTSSTAMRYNDASTTTTATSQHESASTVEVRAHSAILFGGDGNPARVDAAQTFFVDFVDGFDIVNVPTGSPRPRIVPTSGLSQPFEESEANCLVDDLY
jgi:hypothetical protein